MMRHRKSWRWIETLLSLSIAFACMFYRTNSSYKIIEKIQHSLVIDFVDWPHIPVFTGNLAFGEWIAGTFKSRNDSFVLGSKRDKIQHHAFTEGIFYPRMNRANFRIFSTNEARQCLSGKKVYILGDSYMKQMFIGLADILLGDPSNFQLTSWSVRERIYKSINQRLKEAFNGTFALDYKFENLCHADLFTFEQKFKNDLFWKGASAVVMNVVTHHLSAHSKDSDVVKKYLESVKRLFTMRGLKLTWATGPSYDISKVPLQYANTTSQHPFNKINFGVLELARQYKIPLLDFYTLTRMCTWKNCR